MQQDPANLNSKVQIDGTFAEAIENVVDRHCICREYEKSENPRDLVFCHCCKEYYHPVCIGYLYDPITKVYDTSAANRVLPHSLQIRDEQQTSDPQIATHRWYCFRCCPTNQHIQSQHILTAERLFPGNYLKPNNDMSLRQFQLRINAADETQKAFQYYAKSNFSTAQLRDEYSKRNLPPLEAVVAERIIIGKLTEHDKTRRLMEHPDIDPVEKENYVQNERKLAWESLTVQDRSHSLGLTSEELNSAQLEALIKSVLEDLKESGLENLILKSIVYNGPPKIIPSTFARDEKILMNDVIAGRRFEILQHCFRTDLQCHCCGFAMPTYAGPKELVKLGNKYDLKLNHFHPKYVIYFHCADEKCTCSAPKYYATIERFKESHKDGVGSRKLRNLTPPQVHLCADLCAKDQGFKDNIHLQFSRANLFGPLPPVPYCLSILSMVEEAGIRRICIFGSFHRLTSKTNLGLKGNLTFLHQKSKLAYILPNMPADICFLLIRYYHAQSKKIKDLRCRRPVMYDALKYLIIQCKHPSWSDATIGPENLLAWPEDGTLDDFKELIIAQLEWKNCLAWVLWM